MSKKPIETRYHGFRFRSRLEARWAMFFDEIGLKYEYEVEGFKMNGTCYSQIFTFQVLIDGLKLKQGQ